MQSDDNTSHNPLYLESFTLSSGSKEQKVTRWWWHRHIVMIII